MNKNRLIYEMNFDKQTSNNKYLIVLLFINKIKYT